MSAGPAVDEAGCCGTRRVVFFLRGTLSSGLGAAFSAKASKRGAPPSSAALLRSHKFISNTDSQLIDFPSNDKET